MRLLDSGRGGRALVLAAAVSCGLAVASEPSANDAASEELHALFDEAWQHRMREDPLEASLVGDHRYGDRLPDVSLAAQVRRAETRARFLERANRVDRAALSPSDRISLDMFEAELENDLAEHRSGAHLIPITNRAGFHVSFPQLASRVPLDDASDYESYVARLASFDRYVAQHVELMREGIERGMVLPRISLAGIDDVLSAHVVGSPEESLLYAPLIELPDGIDDETRVRLEREASRAIVESVVPGYRRFLDFIRDEYLPAARKSIGASALPGGDEFYAHRIRRFTTLPLTAEEIHRTGLNEVARIRSEMKRVASKTGHEGALQPFFDHLRTSPEFYARSERELLERTAYVLKKMDGRLPELFGHLPRTPYGIEPVPDFIAPRTTTAYYERPRGDGTSSGTYFVNTFDLKARPLYEVEALSLHEAVPGHHLQIAIAQELDGLPRFRRFGGVTAFVEGWALYAERLGLEAGFYEDPYSDFGRLTYEMWRACRLVVDTGIHAMGWSRQRAIDFMLENSALSERNVTNEVDRYIAWPGQALAYKTGELEIRRLRAEAEGELGERFDVRAFHDLVLGEGAIPLAVLGRRVEAWIASHPPGEASGEPASDEGSAAGAP